LPVRPDPTLSSRPGAGVLALLLLAGSSNGACSPGYLDTVGPIDAGTACDAGCPAAGWALRFDGTADCARALRPVSKDFTIEAWVLLDATASGTTWWQGFPFFWADLDAQANDFSATLLNGTFDFVTGSASGDAIISSKSTIPTSQWVHLAVTRTMSTGLMTLFVNGHTDASGTGTTVALTGQSDLWIFCSNTNLFTPGTIDELRAWNVARSEADIQATMHRRLTGNETGLVGDWSFDDGSGMSAMDGSPTGNPLILGGGTGQQAPTWVVSTAPIYGP
jgi:hypothetical protein